MASPVSTIVDADLVLQGERAGSEEGREGGREGMREGGKEELQRKDGSQVECQGKEACAGTVLPARRAHTSDRSDGSSTDT